MATRRPHGARSKKTGAAPAPRLGHGEYVVYPGTRAEVYDLLERLSAAAGDSPDFGTPGISLDRTRLTVRWFGGLPPAVQAGVDPPGGKPPGPLPPAPVPPCGPPGPAPRVRPRARG